MLHKIQLGIETLFIAITIHWQPLFGIAASIAAIIYYSAMLKINVVDEKYEGSWVKYLQSIFKSKNKCMWEKFNKIKAQVIAVMIIIICSFGLSFYGVLFGIPESSQVLVNKVTDIALVASVAWLFNANNRDADKSKPKSNEG